MTTPDVSVIIPCYNVAQTVRQTVQSVRDQTTDAWEIVCIDDASTDDTPSVLTKLAAEDTRIRWRRVEHGGLGAARNAGVALARADRVFFLDADDLMLPSALESLVAASRALGDNTVVTAGWELVAEDGRRMGLERYPSVPGEPFDAFLQANRMTAMALVPKRLLGAAPYRAMPACEDWDLWLRLAHEGASFATTPKLLLQYRARSGSMSRKADVMFDAGLSVLGRWLPHARDPNAVTDARRRWAIACGALALAYDDATALARYISATSDWRPTERFVPLAAGAAEWAFSAAHAAEGRTWRTDGERWAAQIEVWLKNSELAPYAAAITAALRQITRSAADDAEDAARFLQRRPDAETLVVYGVGTNGRALLERLLADARFARVRVAVADDYANEAVLSALPAPHVNLDEWRVWPQHVVAVVTANDPAPMRSRLTACGGREGRDFVALRAAVDGNSDAHDVVFPSQTDSAPAAAPR